MDKVNSPADLTPGCIGFGPIRGGAGLLVSAGQLMLGEGFRVGRLDVRHVFVVTAGAGPELPGARAPMGLLLNGNDGTYREMPKAVEAEPGGAQEVHIGDRWSSDYAYVRLPEDYPGQADDAAAIARAMIGTPYSFGSYAALAAWRLGWKTPRLEKWIDRRKKPVSWEGNRTHRDGETYDGLALPCEAICSVLADQAWSLTGKKIMEGVAHQCVTPGALAARLLEMDGAQWIWPGRERVS